MSIANKLLPLCAAVAFAFAAPTQAASLNLNAQTLNVLGFGDATTATGAPINVLSAPSANFYGDTLPTTLVLSPLVANNTYDFADYYTLQVPNGTANGSTISIDLGTLLNLDRLHVNLYSGAAYTVNPGPATVISSSDVAIGNLNVSILADTVLTPGFYTLEVLGDVKGSAGASYGGTLNITPVPVPAAVWMLGSALTSVMVTRRRKAA